MEDEYSPCDGAGGPAGEDSMVSCMSVSPSATSSSSSQLKTMSPNTAASVSSSVSNSLPVKPSPEKLAVSNGSAGPRASAMTDMTAGLAALHMDGDSLHAANGSMGEADTDPESINISHAMAVQRAKEKGCADCEGPVSGVVKWFSFKLGYGFVIRDDGKGDVFVYQASISKNGYRTLAQGEKVLMFVDHQAQAETPQELAGVHKGPEARLVVGPDGGDVVGCINKGTKVISKDKPAMRCYVCCAVGHLASNCPLRRGRYCHQCGEEGHLRASCPNLYTVQQWPMAPTSTVPHSDLQQALPQVPVYVYPPVAAPTPESPQSDTSAPTLPFSPPAQDMSTPHAGAGAVNGMHATVWNVPAQPGMDGIVPVRANAQVITGPARAHYQHQQQVAVQYIHQPLPHMATYTAPGFPHQPAIWVGPPAAPLTVPPTAGYQIYTPIHPHGYTAPGQPLGVHDANGAAVAAFVHPQGTGAVAVTQVRPMTGPNPYHVQTQQPVPQPPQSQAQIRSKQPQQQPPQAPPSQPPSAGPQVVPSQPQQQQQQPIAQNHPSQNSHAQQHQPPPPPPPPPPQAQQQQPQPQPQVPASHLPHQHQAMNVNAAGGPGPVTMMPPGMVPAVGYPQLLPNDMYYDYQAM